MRRVVGIVAAAALASALSFSVASAADLSTATGSLDIGSALMLSLFGETSDASASFAAAQGDRTSESPFRDLALAIRSSQPVPDFATAAAAFSQDRIALTDLYSTRNSVRFTPSTTPRDDVVALMPSSALFTAAYQPVDPTPSISPGPGTLAFAPAAPSAPSDSLALDEHAATMLAPAKPQIGPVRFESHSDTSASVTTPKLDLANSTYGAGANFDVRAGKRNVSVNLSSEYDTINAGGGFSALSLGSSSWQLPGGAPIVLPNDAGLNRLSFGAGVAVPVMHGLTLNLNYAAQRLYNGYGAPGLVNLDAVNNSVGGGLTFHIPDSSSSLSISAYQDRYGDSLLPIANGSTQTREDVNFTVKF